MNDRARQFLPFSALRGFEEALREKEKIQYDPKELSEEEATQLNQKIRQVHKNRIIRVLFYENKEYITVTGMVSEINFERKELIIAKKKIPFDCIYEIDFD